MEMQVQLSERKYENEDIYTKINIDFASIFFLWFSEIYLCYYGLTLYFVRKVKQELSCHSGDFSECMEMILENFLNDYFIHSLPFSSLSSPLLIDFPFSSSHIFSLLSYSPLSSLQ